MSEADIAYQRRVGEARLARNAREAEARRIGDDGWDREKRQKLGAAVDDLLDAVRAVNAASEAVASFGLRVSLSINGVDYGDRIALRLEGDGLEQVT